MVHEKLISETAEKIAKDEGYRQFKYLDSEGIETIGIGFNLEQGFSKAECDLILNHRITKLYIHLELRLCLFRDMPDTIKKVLVNMAYNLGVNGLMKFQKMFLHLGNGNWESAADEMLDSKWHTQVGERAERLAKIVYNEQFS